MAVGDIVFARFPITIDSGAVADTSLQTGLAALFAPLTTFDVIHTELVFDEGTRTKGTVIIIAQAIA